MACLGFGLDQQVPTVVGVVEGGPDEPADGLVRLIDLGSQITDWRDDDQRGGATHDAALPIALERSRSAWQRLQATHRSIHRGIEVVVLPDARREAAQFSPRHRSF